jgi:hypothetical protein
MNMRLHVIAFCNACLALRETAFLVGDCARPYSPRQSVTGRDIAACLDSGYLEIEARLHKSALNRAP